MDQGVVKCLNALERRRLDTLMIRLDQGQDLPQISMLCALQLLEASWNNVNKAAVINYFWKAKTS